MEVVDFETAVSLLIGIINADKSSSFSMTVTDKKQNLDFLKTCVRMGDADVVTKGYLKSLSSEHRGNFLEDSGELDHGDYIGDHIGLPGPVVVQIAEDGDFVESTPARSKDQIRRWREKGEEIYGAAHDSADSPLGARHRIEDDHIYFTGTKARVKLGQFEIGEDACQASEEDTMLVVSRAVIYAHKEGYVSDWLFREHLAMSEKGLAEIRANGFVTTPIDLAVKAGV